MGVDDQFDGSHLSTREHNTLHPVRHVPVATGRGVSWRDPLPVSRDPITTPTRRVERP